MAKRVTIIASGETERRSLPYLVSHLQNQGITVTDVRIPPRNRALNVGMAQGLIRDAWYSSLEWLPDKFVVLVDTDGKSPVETLAAFQNISDSLPDVGADVLVTYAQWHLEAWYFGDSAKLRSYVGGALGNVDPSRPDEIENPKLHLKALLHNRRGAVYTARTSEEIARKLDARVIAQRSPSFQGFLNAVMNGNPATVTG